MLILLAQLSTLTFILTSAFVGLRLLNLSRRTRGLPEFLLGYGFIMITCVSYPLILLSHAIADEASGAARIAWMIATLSSTTAWMSVFAFVHVVFRPGVRSSFAFAGLGSVAMLAAGIYRLIYFLQLPTITEVDRSTFAVVGISAVALVAYLWMTFESLRYWRIMKRRRAIGLGDPVVTNRFLIFACVAFLSIIALLAQLAPPFFGTDPINSPASLATTAVAGISTSTCLLLAFVPPRRFEAWIRKAAEAEAA